MAELTPVIKDSFIQFAGAVLQNRALVDVRDCIKPSARQIFYCMQTDQFVHSKPFQKTLKAIGSAFRTYIHGDSSAEGVIMRAGQPFAMRYPLVEVEGSYGTLIESGSWAAPRYTSSRLSKLSEYLFKDLDKDAIEEWRDNYDNTEQYPAVLPSKGFYNLVNGSYGIGVGASSSIPQYNLKELNNALIYLINNPDCQFEDIYIAPDFATGGILINENEIKESMKKGSGAACKLRSVINFDEKDYCFVVTEIPYMVYTNTICQELEEIINSDGNPGIDRFNDLTGEKPLIKIYLSKKVNPDKILQFLYKNTSLQSYYGINFTMLDKGRYPKVFTWKEMLQAHIDHEKEVYRRGFEYDLNKYKSRVHILDGLLICLAKIDEVVHTIKNSNSTADAKAALIKTFLLDEEQAKAVLDMKLSRLANLEVKKLEDEKTELLNKIAGIEDILNDEIKFNNEIIKDWRDVAKKFGDERRTVIRNIVEKNPDDIPDVAPEDCIIVLTEGNTIKRVSSSVYKPQKRNGRGIKTQEDITSMIIRTNTIDSLMIFSNKGNLYRLPVDSIPEGTNSSKGFGIKSLVAMSADENASVIYSIYRGTDAKYVLFVTKKGLIKKTSLEEYVKTRKKTGLAAITLNKNDDLAAVLLIKEEPIILVSANGQIIKINSTEINPQGRIAMGVRGMELSDNDFIVSALAIRDKNDSLALFSESGLGKKILPNELTTQHRAGKGVCCYKIDKGTGKVSCAAMVSDEDNLLVVGKTKSICISAKELPALGRTCVGNLILKDSAVIGVSKI